MLAPSPLVKYTAKKALKPRIMPSVIVSCVLIFTCYIISFIGSIVSVFSGIIGFFLINILLNFFIAGPLLLGVLGFFNRVLWNQDDSVIVIFKYFSSIIQYKRALKFILILLIKLVSASLILFLPCVIISILSNEAFFSLFSAPIPVWTSILSGVNSFITILALFALCFVMLKYYLSAFVFISNDTIDPAEAINMSTIISRRTGGDFFGLILSFAPWFLLSLLVVPLIIVIPYFLTAYAVHCHHAVSAYNLDVEHFSGSYAPSFSTDEI